LQKKAINKIGTISFTRSGRLQMIGYYDVAVLAMMNYCNIINHAHFYRALNRHGKKMGNFFDI